MAKEWVVVGYDGHSDRVYAKAPSKEEAYELLEELEAVQTRNKSSGSPHYIAYSVMTAERAMNTLGITEEGIENHLRLTDYLNSRKQTVEQKTIIADTEDYWYAMGAASDAYALYLREPTWEHFEDFRDYVTGLVRAAKELGLTPERFHEHFHGILKVCSILPMEVHVSVGDSNADEFWG